MIDSRRAPSPTGPSTTTPALSGPRCASVPVIRSRTMGSGRAAASAEATPQMPHMAASLGGGAARARVGSVLVGQLRGAGLLGANRAARPRQHLAERRGDDGEVEAHGAVRDVFEVMTELERPWILARDAHLREPGDAGPHDHA